MKKESTKRRLDPGAASLREMPEIDFAACRIRRNPYSGRIAREGLEVAHHEPAAASLAEMPEADFGRSRLRPNKYAAKAVAATQAGALGFALWSQPRAPAPAGNVIRFEIPRKSTRGR